MLPRALPAGQMIEAVALTKFYDKTLAVDDLSFTVQPGRVTGFLGPNGAGKSTTLRMILGLDRPDAGVALIHGRPYRELERPLRGVGALLDATWVHPNRSARAHLGWLARANDLPASAVDRALELVGLTEPAGRRAGTFSLGMLQRLGIAAALLGDPRTLVFDEPLNGLDPAGIVWLREFLHQLADEGRTVFFSSHLLSEMAVMATDLVVIGRGRLISQGAARDFIDRAAQASVRVRSPQLDQLRSLLTAEGLTADKDGETMTVTNTTSERIGHIAATNGIELHELSPQRGSLEHAFLRLTGEAIEFNAHVPAGLAGAAGVAELSAS
jgi:ABC-2 type transport system ATP-binding protein